MSSKTDPSNHVLTFGPHKGTPLGMAPLDYVATLAGYMVINGMPTGHHEFEHLCRDVQYGRAPAGLGFCRGPSAKITRCILIDQIYNEQIDKPEAKRLAPWVIDYVEHTADVDAARKFIEATYLAALAHGEGDGAAVAEKNKKKH